MEVYLKDCPLIGSQSIPFTEFEKKRRSTLAGASTGRSILLWLAGDKVTAQKSSAHNDDHKDTIYITFEANKFRINELPEAWQTPSHEMHINSNGQIPHGLEPVMEAIVRLESDGIDCLVHHSCAGSQVVPVHISYASPNIVKTIKTKGINLSTDHTWYRTPNQILEQLKEAYQLAAKIRERYGIKREVGSLNCVRRSLPAVQL